MALSWKSKFGLPQIACKPLPARLNKELGKKQPTHSQQPNAEDGRGLGQSLTLPCSRLRYMTQDSKYFCPVRRGSPE